MGKRITRELSEYTPKEIDEYRNLHGGRNPRKPRERSGTTYKTYISGELWEKRKSLYYQSHAKTCARCGSFKRITLHHAYYDRKEFGSEPDDHLVPLCQGCHSDFHEMHGTKKDMRKLTNAFLLTGK